MTIEKIRQLIWNLNRFQRLNLEDIHDVQVALNMLLILLEEEIAPNALKDAVEKIKTEQ